MTLYKRYLYKIDTVFSTFIFHGNKRREELTCDSTTFLLTIAQLGI